ncbi:MAG TPA: FAD/NAD(P)-binding protein [Candidatus Nanoarchaeia archaeon]
MENTLHPKKVKIIKTEQMSSNFKLFRLKPVGWEFPVGNSGLIFTPGQFVLAGLWGYGEAPFGPASSPYERSFIDIGVRRTGNVTSALHRLNDGGDMTIRGPYGNGYPLNFLVGKDLVFVTGGCGIPPIASLIEYVIARRERFGTVYLLYGAVTSKDLLFEERYEHWRKSIKVLLTVDKPTPDWKGHVGLVSELTREIDIKPRNTAVAMCGPGPMTKALENILRPLGIADRRIFVSEERKMSCGIGKCQHCTTGDKYVCTDGPVFYYDQVQGNWD